MANPLSRVIMNNIAQRSGKANPNRRNNNDSSSSSMHISLDQEEMLLSLMKKGKSVKSQVNSYSPSNNRQSMGQTNRPNNKFEKLQLEDLIKGKAKPVSEHKPVRKSNTMMTLDQLAGKAKPTINSREDNKSVSNNKEPYKRKTSNVKSNVIGNLEAYVPKVTLDSIGKKGSLR